MLLYSSNEPIFDATEAFPKDERMDSSNTESGSVLVEYDGALAGAWQTDGDLNIDKTIGVTSMTAGTEAGSKFVGLARLPINVSTAGMVPRMDEFTMPSHVLNNKGVPAGTTGAAAWGVGQTVNFKLSRKLATATTPKVFAETAGVLGEAEVAATTAATAAAWSIGSDRRTFWVDTEDSLSGATSANVTARTILTTAGDKIRAQWTYAPSLDEQDTNLFFEYGVHQGIGHYESPQALDQWKRANTAVYTKGRFITTMYDTTANWDASTVIGVKTTTGGKFTTAAQGDNGLISRIRIIRTPKPNWPFLQIEIRPY